MKFIKLITALVIIGLFFCFCNESDSNINGLRISGNVYNYSGFDSTGTKITTGWLSLTFENDGRISGEWNFQTVGNPQQIGPQTTSGQLDGVYDSTSVSVNLNPNWRDNNVFLNGIKDGNKISGTWNYVGFPGVINSGPFIAKK